jgi:demethylmenaquinone methyltransferase/2-methoxy-6-polyprenyl-1,4-benzoquinol methylase
VSGTADLERALEHYRELAPVYDRSTRLIDSIRRRTIDALDLASGESVLDVGCGTGWCLPLLAQRVGHAGRVIGFEPSPDMLRLARQRVAGIPFVELLSGQAETVTLPQPVDAILLSYTHDVLRSELALDNILAQARPGARVAATSTKLYAPWLLPANWYLRLTHRRYITNFEGLAAPWSLLAPRLEEFRVRTSPFSQHYVATGIVPRARVQRAKNT